MSGKVEVVSSPSPEVHLGELGGPAYRIETRRLVARCWEPADARALRAALDENDGHLRPWITWMRHEPRSIEETTQWLRGARAAFDSDTDFRYALLDPAGGRLIGEVVLLGRVGPGALEVGYWIDHRLTGRGLATEAAAAVTRVAFELHRVGRVEIHHSAANGASAVVPKRLGFTLDGTLRRRARDSDDVVRDLSIWSLFSDEYPGSPASRVTLTASDATGATIPLPSPQNR